MTRALVSCLVMVLVPAPSWAPAGASSTLLRPSLYGQVFVVRSTRETPPLAGARLQLFPLETSARGFALAGPRPVFEGHTDARGFYSFYNLRLGVYRLQVVGSRGIGGGVIVRVETAGAAVPAVIIDWNDPCRELYGTGYAVDYIRTKINVPWRANAGDWLDTAARSDWRTSGKPATPERAGMIAVFPATRTVPYGHVAWVESVDPVRRTFVVSQWNEPGPVAPGQSCWKTSNFGRLTTREWRFGDPQISGFISGGGPR